MEPMTLGSPTGSPSTNASQYLPSFLMGETQMPSTPRCNTLSPNKSGRNVTFAGTPTTPQDYNRSAVGQKTLFGYQQSPGSYTGMPLQANNGSITGPPTQGLFDSLRFERNQIQSPTVNAQSKFELPVQHSTIIGQSPLDQGSCPSAPYQLTDSYIASTSYNVPRIASPLANIPCTSLDFRDSCATPINNTNFIQFSSLPRYCELWITVFGFPPTATVLILQHFTQCGTIVDKIFPQQNGNWVHLKFSSRLECDKALNYNEKILGNNIMIGVTQCKDKAIIDKENSYINNIQTPRVRPLAQAAYKGAQNESAVVSTSNPPQKSSGLMTKAMDYILGI